MDYSEQLKSPMWQKKRLEIMERDDFTCQCCGNNDSQLQVHHTYYEYGKKVWEYEDGSLITFCNECHQKTSTLKKEIKFKIDEYFIGHDYLEEVNGIINVLKELNPYELLEIKNSLLTKYIYKDA